VKQIVLEAHDIDGRVKEITALLSKHGFTKITAEVSGWAQFFGLDNVNIYASRTI
jgi:hypothetical protein